MASSGKQKTTMAKRERENRLRERRATKKAKKDARKHASPEPSEFGEGSLEDGMAEAIPPDLAVVARVPGPGEQALDDPDVSA